MDYKIKYNKALEKAKKLYGKHCIDNVLENLFPELKESKDERIRKGLIKAVSRIFDGYKLFDTDVTREEALTWLEKQKDNIKFPNSAYTSNKDVIEFADKYSHIVWEKLMNNFKKIENYNIGCNDVSDIVLNAIINTYIWLEGQDEKKRMKKHIFNADDWYVSKVDGKIHNAKFIEKQDEKKLTDKIEPKFKPGDWITNGQLTCKVLSVTGKSYELHLYNDDYCHFETDVQSVDKHYHLWTIQDAKDGDVLVILPKKGSESNEQIFLFKAINSRDYVDNCIEYYCRLCDGAFYKNKTGYMGTTLDTFYPATKKQRDLLFQKMKEAGYEMADSHPHWISVEDKEPPKGQWIITYEPTSPIVVGTDIILPDETADEHHITLWMPLPQEPKKGE